MAEARKDRKTRTAHDRPAGEALFFGGAAEASVLEAALRAQGTVERATHGFHSYPAGLHPEAARLLLGLGEGPVLDPFCGGGTVLVEALLAGRPALGLDISPVALIVARARAARSSPDLRTRVRAEARALAEAARRAEPDPGVPEELRGWYDPRALAELAAIRRGIWRLAEEGTPAQKEAAPLLKAVFSSILVKTSYRESETANRRVAQPREPGSTAVLFHARAREYARQLEALEQGIAAAAGADAPPADADTDADTPAPAADKAHDPAAPGSPPPIRARAHRQDAREIRSKERFGQIVTSPPYPGVYDYLAIQQLRYLWMGLDPGDPHSEIGSRRSFRVDRGRAFEQWREDTGRWVRATAKLLLPKGRMVVIVGDGFVNHRIVESIPAILEAAKGAGLRSVARCMVERPDEGVGAIRLEHALLLERIG